MQPSELPAERAKRVLRASVSAFASACQHTEHKVYITVRGRPMYVRHCNVTCKLKSCPGADHLDIKLMAGIRSKDLSCKNKLGYPRLFASLCQQVRFTAVLQQCFCIAAIACRLLQAPQRHVVTKYSPHCPEACQSCDCSGPRRHFWTHAMAPGHCMTRSR